MRFVLALRVLITAAVLTNMIGAASPRSGQDKGREPRQPEAGLLYYAKANYAFADNSDVIANPYICGALFQVI